MKTTRFLVHISSAQNDIYKAVEALAFQIDAKQWPMAGIELGRIEELANKIAGTCRLARDSLHEDAWLDDKAKRADAETPGEANP